MTKKYIVLLFLLHFFAPTFVAAQNYLLKSPTLTLEIDKATGGVQSIVNASDKYKMNWILKSDSTQYSWQTSKLAWGLGFGVIKGDTVRWNNPVTWISNGTKATVHYQNKYFKLIVDRSLNKDGSITESFQFKNTTIESYTITDLGIYTPFNDNYPNSKQCVESRCNAHIWAGGSSSYVFAERMGGEAPNLGLVWSAGAMKSYEILNRHRKAGGSNVRGTIVSNSSDITLKPNQSYTLSWRIFTATDWSDFYQKAKNDGFVKATAQKYVIEKDEPLQVAFESNRKLHDVSCTLNGQKVAFVQNSNKIVVNVRPTTFGEQLLKMDYDHHQTTFVKVLRIANIDQLIKKRVNFIVKKQQMNDTTDARYGAYMVYDNETHKIYLNNDKLQRPDLNEARERVGMGVLLAVYLQKYPDAVLQKSLDRYCKFVRSKLQQADYKVLDGLGRTKNRIYNYPWVAQLYLEMYKLTHQRNYLTDYYHTSRKYYIEGKYSFYGIGMPVQKGLAELKTAGLINEYDTLLNDCRQMADNYVKTSLYYPKSEVNYEQSIVGPSVIFLLEMYQVTKEKSYLVEAEKQLKALESFGGKQPDYHLNDISIRHWDGYWFGKRETWGDIMPHYWSAITSEAYASYAVISGNKAYFNRAESIVKSNLCNFFEDGTASCAYVYPSKVNGEKGGFFDPFANDQDWALVFYYKYLQLVNQ